eukprot:6182420-Pleurochrysis_carterae.AAC.7
MNENLAASVKKTCVKPRRRAVASLSRLSQPRASTVTCTRSAWRTIISAAFTNARSRSASGLAVRLRRRSSIASRLRNVYTSREHVLRQRGL